MKKQRNNPDKQKNFISVSLNFLAGHKADIVLFGFIALCLTPVFDGMYYGDDAVSRDIYAFIRQENRTFIQYILNQMQYYIINAGRFYPVHVIHRFLTFYIFNNITSYRIFVFVMNFFAIVSFASMVRVYTGSKKLFYAVMILFPGVFLFLTRYDDAITSYYMFIQTLVIYLSISLILFKRYIEKKKGILLVFSVILYVLSLLTYESSYPLAIVYPLAAFFILAGTEQRLRKAITLSVPYFAAAFLCFIAYISFSMNAVSDYQGIHFSPDLGKIVVTFLKQVIASFPVVPHAYLIFNRDWKFIFDINNALNNITIVDIITAILFVFLLSRFLNTSEDEKAAPEGKRFIIWLSVMLIICPSLIISVSMKYQQSLTWGLGYLTIYITRFGLLLLAYYLYEAILLRIKKAGLKVFLQTITVAVLVTVLLFCRQGNRNVLTYKNQSPHLREVAEESIKAGLLRGIPDGSIILLGNIWYDYPSFNRNGVFINLCNARVTTDTISHFISESYKNLGEPKTYLYQDHHVYYFHFEKFQSNTGYAFCGRLDTMSIDEKSITGMTATNFKLFYSGEECEAVDILVEENGAFVRKRFPLSLYGYKKYIVEIPGLVDLESVELVRKIKPSIWEPAG